eukprot:359522-Chlamydomonas_euryale.AAC.4
MPAGQHGAEAVRRMDERHVSSGHAVSKPANDAACVSSHAARDGLAAPGDAHGRRAPPAGTRQHHERAQGWCGGQQQRGGSAQRAGDRRLSRRRARRQGSLRDTGV